MQRACCGQVCLIYAYFEYRIDVQDFITGEADGFLKDMSQTGAAEGEEEVVITIL